MGEPSKVERLIHLTRLFVQRHLEPWPEFVAAMIIGSVAHGEAAPVSDVDCLFVFDRYDDRIVPAEFVWQPDTNDIHTIFEVEADEIGGVQIDAIGRRVALEQFATTEWEEGFKHDLSGAIVLFDRDHLVTTLMKTKLHYPDALRVERVNAHYAKAEYYVKEWRVRRWITRSGYACGHDQLTAAFEELLQLLHAYNRAWLPWRYRWLISAQNLEWLPAEFADLLPQVLAVGALTEDNLMRRRATLQRLLEEVGNRLHEERFANDPAKAFAATYKDLGYAHNMAAWKVAHLDLLRDRGMLEDL